MKQDSDSEALPFSVCIGMLGCNDMQSYIDINIYGQIIFTGNKLSNSISMDPHFS